MAESTTCIMDLPLETSLEIIDDGLVFGFSFIVSDGVLVVLEGEED